MGIRQREAVNELLSSAQPHTRKARKNHEFIAAKSTRCMVGHLGVEVCLKPSISGARLDSKRWSVSSFCCLFYLSAINVTNGIICVFKKNLENH